MRFLMRAPDMAEEMVEQSSEKFTERYVRAPMLASTRYADAICCTTDASHADIDAASIPRAGACPYYGAGAASHCTSDPNTGHGRTVASRHSRSTQW